MTGLLISYPARQVCFFCARPNLTILARPHSLRTPPEQDGEDEEDGPPRSFVQFVLEPLYKLIGHSLGEEKESLMKILADVGVILPRRDYDLSTKNLLKQVGRAFFQGCHAFVDCVVEHIRNPKEMAPVKIAKTYSGGLQSDVGEHMSLLPNSGLLMVHTVKNYHESKNMSDFLVLGRVMSGTLY